MSHLSEKGKKKKTQGPCRISKLDIWMSHLSKKKKLRQLDAIVIAQNGNAVPL